MKDLSQDQYPKTFRYYDFIINFIQERISEDRREFYGLKKALSLNMFQNSSENKLKEKITFQDKSPDKLTYKHSVVNLKQRKEIDHNTSTHVPQLQRSKYLKIDNKVTSASGGTDKRSCINELNLKFCLEKEIQKQR